MNNLIVIGFLRLLADPVPFNFMEIWGLNLTMQAYLLPAWGDSLGFLGRRRRHGFESRQTSPNPHVGLIIVANEERAGHRLSVHLFLSIECLIHRLPALGCRPQFVF